MPEQVPHWFDLGWKGYWVLLATDCPMQDPATAALNKQMNLTHRISQMFKLLIRLSPLQLGFVSLCENYEHYSLFYLLLKLPEEWSFFSSNKRTWKMTAHPLTGGSYFHPCTARNLTKDREYIWCLVWSMVVHNSVPHLGQSLNTYSVHPFCSSYVMKKLGNNLNAITLQLHKENQRENVYVRRSKAEN